MKKTSLNISWLIATVVMLTSCDAFLKEEPKTFLTPSSYFKNEKQIVAAVNGIYTYVGNIFNGDIEVNSHTFTFMEYMTGYGFRPRGAGTQDMAQAVNLSVADNNNYLSRLWQTAYTAIENCNSTIEGIESIGDGIISEDRKKELLGEVYFLRAFNYFNLVRLFGPVPLKLTSTKDLSEVQIELTSIEGIYTQVELDMTKARELMNHCAWTNNSGRVTKGTVQSMLVKLYLTMAGYPLQKGNSYYQKAYEAAREVTQSGAYRLYNTYAELRNTANAGEYIWSIQRDATNAGSPVHNSMLPFPAPAKAISQNATFGGGLAPTQIFYNSYPAGDKRTAEKGFYYTEHEALDGSGMVALGAPYIYKFWDAGAATSGRSGANYALLRYADVLLMLAEAKAQADGGTTTNTDAIDAYFAVRSRALPSEAKPSAIAVNDILKERFWEICFEGHTWYDMLRTRKVLHVNTGLIVDIIGYQTPGHGSPFKESDLLFPYPIREQRLNPNLKR